jgi:hypothetical protein
MKMKTIKIVGTKIKIACATAEEMHLIFARLHGWESLEVDGEVYEADTRTAYTVSYFRAKYFGRA